MKQLLLLFCLFLGASVNAQEQAHMPTAVRENVDRVEMLKIISSLEKRPDSFKNSYHEALLVYQDLSVFLRKAATGKSNPVLFYIKSRDVSADLEKNLKVYKIPVESYSEFADADTNRHDCGKKGTGPCKGTKKILFDFDLIIEKKMKEAK